MAQGCGLSISGVEVKSRGRRLTGEEERHGSGLVLPPLPILSAHPSPAPQDWGKDCLLTSTPPVRKVPCSGLDAGRLVCLEERQHLHSSGACHSLLTPAFLCLELFAPASPSAPSSNSLASSKHTREGPCIQPLAQAALMLPSITAPSWASAVRENHLQTLLLAPSLSFPTPQP